MEEYRLIVDLVIALGAALLGGAVAQRLGQPVLIGYIIAGILIGPNTPGLVADIASVETLAGLGVAFLMFTIGVELSFSELRHVRRVAIMTGGIQIPLTIVVGILAGLAIGWSWQAAAVLGGCFAISSTIVLLKLAASRGEANSPHARTALGIGIVQDLALVPIIALLPVLTGDSDNIALSLLRSLGIAAIALVLVVVVGTKLAPPVLYAVARFESRELFLVAIVFIALGTALLSELAGLSLALGAFLAGLVVSESEFDSHVLSEVIPLRDLFATLFFVSVGMLLEPWFVVENIWLVLGLLATLVIGKLLITGGALLAAGANYRTSTSTAALLAQMGEFSFVLASVGLADGIIDRDQYGLILAVASASILISPTLLGVSPALVSLSQRLPGVKWKEAAEVGDELIDVGQPNQVVLCGYGRVGAVLGDVLAGNEFPYSVIEINPVTTRELREKGVRAYYGDAGSDALLIRAGVREASVLVVTVSDLLASRAAVRRARALNPAITIITRAISRNDVQVLMDAGADEVIQPEFEAGLECVDHMLGTLGMSADQIAMIVAARRLSLYEHDDRSFAAI
ncbi:MAG: cation:proton antiporter [Thermomicrobiales bacterium]